MINSEGEVVKEGDCPTTDDDGEMDSDSEVVWAKSARGRLGSGHTFVDKLCFTRDIPEEKWIPKKPEAPTVVKPAPKPAPKRGKQPAAKPVEPVRASVWLMGGMCSCSRLCGTGKRSFTLSLFSRRGMQQTDGLMHCIENFACLHHWHGTIRSLYVSVYFRALGDVQQATDRP